jgi:hypothetical protein
MPYLLLYTVRGGEFAQHRSTAHYFSPQTNYCWDYRTSTNTKRVDLHPPSTSTKKREKHLGEKTPSHHQVALLPLAKIKPTNHHSVNAPSLKGGLQKPKLPV